MWPTEGKPGTFRKYWIRVRGNFIRTGHFLAKLRLLHQSVTGGLHCIILSYEAQLCYYKDAISLNSQAGQWNTGVCCYGQLKHVFSKKDNFTSFQLVYGCLFVYRENVSPRFHHRSVFSNCLFQLSFPTVFSNCLFQLSFPTVFADFLAAFLQEHESILRNTIVYGDITIYRNNVKTLRFLENLHSTSAMHFTS